MELGKSWKNINLANIIDREIYDIFEIIRRHGGEARLVGGVVRDYLIGRKINDVDIGVNLPPAKIVDIFRNLGFSTNEIGAKYGTVSLSLSKERKIEITSLRRDVKTDGRYAEVEYGVSWFEDAARRDFTINALSYDLENQKIYDYFTGMEDLKNKKIRFIGDAEQRIKEDYLRIVRYFRFKSIYGEGHDDEDLLEIFERNRLSLNILSKERKTSEILKIFASENLSNILQNMNKCRVLSVIFGQENLLITENLDNLTKIDKFFKINIWRRLYLFCKTNGLSVKNLSENLSLSNKEKKILENYEEQMKLFKSDFSERNLTKYAYLLGKELVWDLLMIYFAETGLLDFGEAKKIYLKLESILIPIFQVKASDISEKISCESFQLGKILEKLEKTWVESDFGIDKSQLLNELKNFDI